MNALTSLTDVAYVALHSGTDIDALSIVADLVVSALHSQTWIGAAEAVDTNLSSGTTLFGVTGLTTSTIDALGSRIAGDIESIGDAVAVGVLQLDVAVTVVV